jgi:hypothetical protein
MQRVRKGSQGMAKMLRAMAEVSLLMPEAQKLLLPRKCLFACERHLCPPEMQK